MVVLDWTSPNEQMHQVTQAIWHLTAMHFYLSPNYEVKIQGKERIQNVLTIR